MKCILICVGVIWNFCSFKFHIIVTCTSHLRFKIWFISTVQLNIGYNTERLLDIKSPPLEIVPLSSRMHPGNSFGSTFSFPYCKMLLSVLFLPPLFLYRMGTYFQAQEKVECHHYAFIINIWMIAVSNSLNRIYVLLLCT